MRLPCVIVVAATAWLAPYAPALAETTPKGFQCEFRTGSTLSYTNGAFKSRRAKPLAMELADIDLDAQRASIVLDNGKGRLSAMRAINASHFIEAITEGYLNVTTIYDLDPRRKAHPAVHSRHFGLFGEPVVAQYTGFCTPK